VVKRALAKLRVKDDWFADISRGRTEEAFLRYVGTRFPAAVPRVLASDPTAGWFAMEFLGDEFATWKSRLMQGHADTADAHRAGATLGQIHRASWDDSTTAAQFATDENFRQLRVDPYLETTACRVPGMATWLRAEAARLQMTKRALVHGDFSPKNLMVAPDRFVILDAEVAWFGDPAFDTAFVLTHLFLKALLQGQKSEACLASARMFWSTYTLTLGPGADSALEARTTHLLLCLLLARVHGKSPVEYLTQPAQQKLVIDFASAWLPQPPLSLADTLTAWRKCLQHS
jgi:tRNA A-37 threonylcarbamoyl transferase component Bud32